MVRARRLIENERLNVAKACAEGLPVQELAARYDDRICCSDLCSGQVGIDIEIEPRRTPLDPAQDQFVKFGTRS